MKYYLYNSLANNGIKPNAPEGVNLISSIDMDYPKFFESLKEDDEVVLFGGDGTLNYFVNAMKGHEIKNNVYLYGSGTGNDFFRDINKKPWDEVLLNDYIEDLPVVRVNGKERLFVNGFGHGVDGYCCEIADKIRKKDPNKKINYAYIGMKAFLFEFKPNHAKITVDDKTYEFDDVWFAPTMKGKYYGGGMKIAPNQDRFSDTLSVVVFHTRSKLKTLIFFPMIYTGEHVKKKDMITILTGKKIHVEYTRACTGQVDGDTILNVREYTAEIN